MNRIARTLAALIVAAGLTTAVIQAPAEAATNSVVMGNGHWCC
jgi:hypothetical protein